MPVLTNIIQTPSALFKIVVAPKEIKPSVSGCMTGSALFLSQDKTQDHYWTGAVLLGSKYFGDLFFFGLLSTPTMQTQDQPSIPGLKF